MASRIYGNKGQVKLPDASFRDVYTVGTGKQGVVHNIQVANLDTVAHPITVWHRIAGAAQDDKQIIIPATSVEASDFDSFKLGIALAVGDVISVQTDVANKMIVNVYGFEELI